MIDFPSNPTLGQIFDTGSLSYEWNGVAWISVPTTSITYPITVEQGGTDAKDASTARINLGLNTVTGEFVIQKDGTVAAPGLSFLNEPGLGFYRSAPGIIRMASGGNDAVVFSVGTPFSTSIVITPRQAAGVSVLELRNNNTGTVDYNVLGITQNPNGSATINTAAQGTAVRGNLTIDAPVVGATAVLEAPNLKVTNSGILWDNGSSFLISPRGSTESYAWNLGWDHISGNWHFGGAEGTDRFQFDSSLNANKSVAGPWNALVSDVRTKLNIEDYTKGLESVLALRPRTFQYIPEVGFGDSRFIGYVEEEIRGSLPSIPSNLKIPGLPDLMNVDHTPLSYMLVNAIKTLNAEVEHLKTQLAAIHSALEKNNDRLS
jgi:Chaperone of endosialidase